MFCFLPLGIIAAAFFVAYSIHDRERHDHRWSASVLIGVLGSISSLSYRLCGWGVDSFLVGPVPINIVYRGWPLPWWGWIGRESIFVPGGFFFFDLLFWMIAAIVLSYLISLAQWYTQIT
jgi:hypothetical protein